MKWTKAQTAFCFFVKHALVWWPQTRSFCVTKIGFSCLNCRAPWVLSTHLVESHFEIESLPSLLGQFRRMFFLKSVKYFRIFSKALWTMKRHRLAHKSVFFVKVIYESAKTDWKKCVQNYPGMHLEVMFNFNINHLELRDWWVLMVPLQTIFQPCHPEDAWGNLTWCYICFVCAAKVLVSWVMSITAAKPAMELIFLLNDKLCRYSLNDE